MKYTNDLIQRSNEIIQKVKEAEQLNQPIECLVKEQIEILKCHKDEFVRQADKKGIDEFSKSRVLIQLYSNIKFWANKIGLPSESYEKAIKDIQSKFFDN